MSEFKIEIDVAAIPMMAAAPIEAGRLKALWDAIVAKAKELLTGNLPDWPTVEAAVRAAYDTLIRPLSIPNWMDNILENALVREVRKIYDDLAVA